MIILLTITNLSTDFTFSFILKNEKKAQACLIALVYLSFTSLDHKCWWQSYWVNLCETRSFSS